MAGNLRSLELRLTQSIETPAPWIALVATGALGAWLWLQGEQLEQLPSAPDRMVSLQFAWSVKTATTVIAVWKDHHTTAILQVVWDFPFILAYSYLLCAIGLATARAARARNLPRMASIAVLAGWAGLVAGGLDVVENVGLLTMLSAAPFAPIPQITWLCAKAKFALAIASFLVSLAVLLWPSRSSFKT